MIYGGCFNCELTGWRIMTRQLSRERWIVISHVITRYRLMSWCHTMLFEQSEKACLCKERSQLCWGFTPILHTITNSLMWLVFQPSLIDNKLIIVSSPSEQTIFWLDGLGCCSMSSHAGKREFDPQTAQLSQFLYTSNQRLKLQLPTHWQTDTWDHRLLPTKKDHDVEMREWHQP